MDCIMDFSKFRDTGELSDIVVSVDETPFKLHKFPLYVKSDFFKALVKAETEKDLRLTNFPGGPQVFSLVADFCYNIKIDITAENVVYLRCAAEFLQMTGKGNLADLSDRFLHDVVTSAKLSRSPAVLVDLLLQCCKLGRIAKNANITPRCIEAVVHIWLKPPTKFSTPGKKAENNGNDEANMDKLSRLPLDLFHQLIIAGKERVVWPKTLAFAVVRYASKYLFPEDCEKCCQTQSDVSDSETEESDRTLSGDEDEKSGLTPEKEESPRLDDGRVANILDTLIPELPGDAPLEDVASPRWTVRALLVADEQDCRCRPRILKLATQTMHKFSSEDFAEMSAQLICEITEEACRNDRCVPDVVCKVVDNYMLDLARKEELSLEVFMKLSMSLPKEFRPSHDLLFDVLEAILKSNKELTPERRTELIGVLDFSRLGEDTLKRAYDSELFPASYITPAALDLCSRLRVELDSARAIIRVQEEDLKRLAKSKGLGSPNNKAPWVSEPSTPRSNVRFGHNGSVKYRKDDVNSATSGLTSSSGSSASRNGETGTTTYISHYTPTTPRSRTANKESPRFPLEKKRQNVPGGLQNEKPTNGPLPPLPIDNLSLDLSKLTDFSSSGISNDDVKEVMSELADISPRFSSIYMKTLMQKW